MGLKKEALFLLYLYRHTSFYCALWICFRSIEGLSVGTIFLTGSDDGQHFFSNKVFPN